MFAMIAQGAFI